MKRSILLVSFCWLLPCASWAQTPAKKPVKPVAKAVPTPTPKAQTPVAQTPDDKPQLSAAELVTQGKALYQKANFPQALTKFEAALKAEPHRDEALFFAAETAYRLDNQLKARNWFLRRAELANQKDTIKAFSFYRAATTYWREAHDNVAAYATFKEGKTVMSKLPEKGPVTAATTDELIASGLHLIERCVALTSRYAEAHNLKNLLLAEAAWLKSGTVKGEEAQQKALAALRETIALLKGRDAKTIPTDFGAPTLRVGEFPPTKADDALVTESTVDGVDGLKGGTVVKRVAAIFPTSVPRSADSGDDNPDRGGRRGALTAASAPGKVKVEVLISTAGDVTFAHIVQGRSDLNGAAIAAARKWKFAPAKFEDHPVQLSGVITFDMRPGGSRAAATPTPKP
ncbi:MAG: TonB family protein [Acidobacteria bacterium]|nr:TonB family protein [Acidobacteriota bacterium]